jgi:hypothetical protein
MDSINTYLINFKLKPALIKGYAEVLYVSFLSRFEQKPKDQNASKIFQDCMISYVGKLRTLDTDVIGSALKELAIINPCLPDIVIMMWCLPDPKAENLIMNIEHKRLIETCNPKLIDICDHPIVKSFCIETVTKTNYVPIHCIDILWPYMQNRELNLRFENEQTWDFVGFLMSPGDDVDDGNYNMDLSLNIDAVFSMGLGKIAIKNFSLRKLLYPLIFDAATIKSIYETDEGNDFKEQLKRIHANGPEYFANYELPSDIIKYLQ